jgi:hypothetical protein
LQIFTLFYEYLYCWVFFVQTIFPLAKIFVGSN